MPLEEIKYQWLLREHEVVSVTDFMTTKEIKSYMDEHRGIGHWHRPIIFYHKEYKDSAGITYVPEIKDTGDLK